MAASSSAFVYNTLKAPSIDGVTGVLDINTGKAVASAATINLNTATGNRVHITGTTAITAVILTRGPRTVIFDDILTLTHNATTNNLPGAANITTAAGDRAIYESDGTTVYCVSYIKVSGAALVSASGLVLLSTVTASNSATVDIETTFSSAYAVYLLTVSAVYPVDANVALRCLMKIGGSYVTSGYSHILSYPQGSTYTGAAANTTHAVIIASMTNTAAASNDFIVRIHNPASATNRKKISFDGAVESNGSFANFSGAATNTGTDALTGLRFFAATGNLAAGTFRLYGIANS